MMERRIAAQDTTGASKKEPAASAPMERRTRGEEGESGNRGESRNPGEQVIRWERFLPCRVLRVLLVENDDSTRHIVAALLRKCSYQVAAVADGLKAWEFLVERNYNFDLVLTEVMMPTLSGIGLLSKIMSNEICKHIPVIMMSSHDSIGVVFKCMLKGAVDFLVKPVRKNELRNLWQHVWRKYCLSRCGNGSKNQTRFEAVCDNGANIHALKSTENQSKMSDSADSESDTQSSCSKPDTETRHERAQSEPLQSEHGNFSREIEYKLDKYDSNPTMVATTSLYAAEKEKDKLTGVEINVTLSVQAAIPTEKIREKSYADRSPSMDGNSFSLRCQQDANFNPESFYPNSVQNEPSGTFIDFIGTIATGQCSHGVLEDNSCRKDPLREAEKSSDANKGACSFSSFPLCGLSLERPQINSLNERGFRESHVLKHSDASAFSRYGNRGHLSCPKSGPSPNTCLKTSEFVVNYNPEAGSDRTCNGQSVPFSIKGRLASATSKEETDTVVAQSSKEYAYVGPSSQEVVFSCPQLGVPPLLTPNGAIPFQGMCTGCAILQPIFYPEPSFVSSSVAIQNAIEVHGDSQLVNHFHCQRFNQQNCLQLLEGVKDQIVDEEPSDPHLVLQAIEKADQSGSYSQSNHNGSGSNKSNIDTKAAAIAGVALDSGNEEGFQNCNGKGLDWDRARREAALTKFRLKRKDRCFEKKVRYHSRKKLAEQRPRSKGQFVRQAVVESSMTGTETDD